MLKKIALAAMALVVVAAAIPAQAQSRRRHREYRYRDEPSWLDVGHQEALNVVPGISRAGDRAQEEIALRYASRERDERRYVRERYYAALQRQGVPFGPYVWGDRYPMDSCRYSWNSRRGSCRDYESSTGLLGLGVNIWQNVEIRKLRKELEEANRRADQRAEVRFDEPVERYQSHPRHEQAPVQEEIRPEVVVNLTGHTASFNEKPIGIHGHITVPGDTRGILVAVNSDDCKPYTDRIGPGVTAIKCR